MIAQGHPVVNTDGDEPERHHDDGEADQDRRRLEKADNISDDAGPRLSQLVPHDRRREVEDGIDQLVSIFDQKVGGDKRDDEHDDDIRHLGHHVEYQVDPLSG